MATRCLRRTAATIAILSTLGLTGVEPAVAQVEPPAVEHRIVLKPERPVTNQRSGLFLSVTNPGESIATDITIDATLPPEATIVGIPPYCSRTPTGVTCHDDSVGARTNTGPFVFVEFAAEGTFRITSRLTAASPATDVTEFLDVVVEPENADLVGLDRDHVVVVGRTKLVSHIFRNNGPTGAGEATIVGEFPPGATIVPGTFSFGNGYLETPDKPCIVTSATFTCFPATANYFNAGMDNVGYEAIMPTTPGTVVATATITGRNDPDPTNNTSTVTIDVRPESAEIATYVNVHNNQTEFDGGVPKVVTGQVQSYGELPAENVVASLTVPDGWTAEIDNVSAPADFTCAAQPGATEIRCEMESLPTASSGLILQALVTAPSTGTGSGVITMTGSTESPEVGTFPNVGTVEVLHRSVDPTFDVELGPLHYIEAIGPPGSATVSASLHCDEALDNVNITFELEQQTPTPTTASSDITVDCAAGQTLHVPSDLMPGFSPGPATATVDATHRFLHAVDTGPITITSNEDVLAALQQALAGPDGAAIQQQLVDGILFRLANSPVFRQAFIEALFAPPS